MKKGHPRGFLLYIWDDTGGMDLKEGREVKICHQPTSFPVRSGLWISREFLLDLGVGIKQQVEEGS